MIIDSMDGQNWATARFLFQNEIKQRRITSLVPRVDKNTRI